MMFLPQLFRRRIGVQHVCEGDKQHFISHAWRITLPLGWQLRIMDHDALYFESSDRYSGIYVSLLRLHPEQNRSLHEVAARLHAASRAGLCALTEYEWCLQQDEIHTDSDGGTAVLDAHDQGKGYRLYTRTEVRPSYALRLAYHDMLCQNYAARRHQAQEVLASARITV